MAKIDLSGKAGWQSKSSDKIKSLQEGNYNFKEVVLGPDRLDYDWIESGLIIQVIQGRVKLITKGEVLEYEKDEIIYLNDENIQELKLELAEEIILGIFKEK